MRSTPYPRQGKHDGTKRKIDPLLRAVLIGALIIPILFAYFYSPWEQQYRANALPVINAELDKLPIPDGSAEVSRRSSSDPNAPYVYKGYRRSTSCDVIQTHYGDAVTASNWKPGGEPIHQPNVTKSYHKTIQGYYLTLLISCDPQAGKDSELSEKGAYSLYMQLPFPYSVSFIGPWLSRI